jgi:hypothetical protein
MVSLLFHLLFTLGEGCIGMQPWVEHGKIFYSSLLLQQFFLIVSLNFLCLTVLLQRAE